MTDFEYEPNSIIGTRPVNLSDNFSPDYADGSMAGMLYSAGYYRGLHEAFNKLQVLFESQPGVLAQITDIFIEPEILEGAIVDG